VGHELRRFEMNNNPDATPAGAILSRQAVWAGYAACAWAFAFAATSFYWAAGGTVGGDTIGPAITSLAHEPTFIAILWITGAMKLFSGLIALALVAARRRLDWGWRGDTVRRRQLRPAHAYGQWRHWHPRRIRRDGDALAPRPLGSVVDSRWRPVCYGRLASVPSRL
jgi:hypothetical protein